MFASIKMPEFGVITKNFIIQTSPTIFFPKLPQPPYLNFRMPATRSFPD